jgi:CubicO group peptidase (beta-lactamase class C family)
MRLVGSSMVVSALLICLASACTRATDRAGASPLMVVTPEAVDAEVGRLMALTNTTGLTLALIENGAVVHQRAFGWANRDARTPLSTRTVMNAASLTKAAFAYAVMTLIDEGVLDLDRPIGEYLSRPLPHYEEWTDLAGDDRWRRFTPRMLLSHTSGLLNWRRFNDDQRLDIKFDPGSRYVYSGEGMQVLQFVIEEGLGRDVGALMQERVFERFGMRDTSMTWRSDFEGHHAHEYAIDGRDLGYRQRRRPRVAGSMDTTLADYARFMAGLLRAEGLSPASHAEMLRSQIAIDGVQQFPSHWASHTNVYAPIALGYALGWGVYTSSHGRAFFKEGHDDGTSNYVLGFPARRAGLVVLSNSSNAEAMFEPLIDFIYGETCDPWFWHPYIPHDRPEFSRPSARDNPPPPC